MADSYELIEYKDSSGLLIQFEYDGKTFWLSVAQIATLFGATRQNVEKHIGKIYAESELAEKNTSRLSRGVIEGRPNQEVVEYNLDMVISVGYRIRTGTATKFRQWATQVIKDRTSTDYAAMAQEEALRLLTRGQVDESTERLLGVVSSDHHVIDEESFLAVGDQGLYHMSRDEVETEREIPEGKLYDFIGSAELGMHVFRLTQTAEALRNDARNGYRHEQAEAEEIHKDRAERTRATAHYIHHKHPEEMPVEKDIELVKQETETLVDVSEAAKAAHGDQIALEIGLK